MKKILFIILITLTNLSNATIFDADELYKNNHIDDAKTHYQLSAKLGSPHAFYQLGHIHLKGLGTTKQDPLTAFIYFSLAAEYNFRDAQTVASNIKSQLTETAQTAIVSLTKEYIQHYGKKAIEEKYFPKINTENIDKKIASSKEYINNLTELDDDYTPYPIEFDLNSFSADFGGFSNDIFEEDTNDEYTEYDEFGEETDESSNEEINPAPVTEARYRMLIVDADIALDGSLRDIKVIKNTTRLPLNTFLHVFEESNVGQQQLNDKGSPFIYQYNNMSLYNKVMARSEFPKFSSRYRRLAKKYKVKTALEDRYKYVKALMFYPWLDQEKNEINTILEQLSREGHPQAQYDYGMKLYREQSDIKSAIHWLSMASQYGLTEAEYRLGRMLIDSPWVLSDEDKALFWLEKAAEKNHMVAMRKLAELKLLSKNEHIIDLDGAAIYLDKIATNQQENPEYFYLTALHNVKKKPRNLFAAVTNIRKAIDLGERLYWDVSKWEAQLAAWTDHGKVTISDVDE